MIEEYWNEVFGQFKEPTGEFKVPGFLEPLMSAHFGVQNIIAPLDPDAPPVFRLCVFRASKVPAPATYNREDLGAAIRRPEFWDYQVKQNGEAAGFMERLLPFVEGLPTPHHHFFIAEAGEIRASLIAGEADCGVFIFNVSVSREARNRGLARELVRLTQNHFSDKRTFFWTLHAWFTFDAEVFSYRLKL